MSVGAICFTSSGSNGGCWVGLVFPAFFFFLGKKVFFSPIRDLHPKSKFTRLTPKNKISVEKNATCAKKKVTRLTPKKKIKKATPAYFHNRATLASP